MEVLYLKSLEWNNPATITSASFKCAFCANTVASNLGYRASSNVIKKSARIYICPHCNNPTFFNDYNSQYPGPIIGETVANITNEEVKKLYEEARRAASCSAFTAAILCCRKLLMNIAVSKGAEEGLKFIEYVDFLANKGYIPPDGKGWVDQIRIKGNEATHEIKIMSKEDTVQLIRFCEMLLRFVYEFPSYIGKE
jgi:hypothetical protein